jgi:hypothetical protein
MSDGMRHRQSAERYGVRQLASGIEMVVHKSWSFSATQQSLHRFAV